MRIRVLIVCAALALNIASVVAQTPDTGYKLLLTPLRLRRLHRDRERKTIRWLNFEHRVQTVSDSPERGFELALYYAVTRDEARGREAVAWATSHACDLRQVSLIRDWTGDLFGQAQQRIDHTACAYNGPITIQRERDLLFTIVASGSGDLGRPLGLNPHFQGSALPSPGELYALAEYLMVFRSSTHTDLRQENANFFRVLPKEFLLSLKPQQIEQPDWMAHAAALALVAVDPNLEGSQFLQGWAMEDSQMITDGPGVAYEFLWADPYLPGIAYRNLDPWVYDPAGRLFARANWDVNSCWIANDSIGVRQQNCPANVLQTSQTFGGLTLTPLTTPCIDIPDRGNRASLILWRLKPGEMLTYRGEQKKLVVESADAAGMWPVAENVTGKICRGRETKP